MNKRADWPLVVLYFAGEKGLTPAQLQKAIFLVQKAFPKAEKLDYDFKPYNYGPFDAAVYQDVESLANQGLDEIRQKNGYGWNTYHISLKGKDAAEIINATLEEEVRKYLAKLVYWVQSLSFQELIGAIYAKYPEYKENSIFKD